jgi:hypothetical protein
VRKAKQVRGTRFLHILSPCPPGWKYADELTIEMGRMAVRNRVFPLLEVENGIRWRFTAEHPGDPIAPYIRAQGRFRHLDDAAIERIQAEIDAAGSTCRSRWRLIESDSVAPDNGSCRVRAPGPPGLLLPGNRVEEGNSVELRAGAVRRCPTQKQGSPDNTTAPA